jgi:hypothetical protein
MRIYGLIIQEKAEVKMSAGKRFKIGGNQVMA